MGLFIGDFTIEWQKLRTEDGRQPRPRYVSEEELWHTNEARFWQRKADGYGRGSPYSTTAWRKANRHWHAADNARNWNRQ